jgi:hypothetical protein
MIKIITAARASGGQQENNLLVSRKKLELSFVVIRVQEHGKHNQNYLES